MMNTLLRPRRIGSLRIVLTFVLALALTGPIFAAGEGGGAEPIAQVDHNGRAMAFNVLVEFEALTLSVTGPYDFVQEQTTTKNDLVFWTSGETADGCYSWQLTVSPVLNGQVKEAIQRARETGDYSQIRELKRAGLFPLPQIQSGDFTISKGDIIFDPQSNEKALTLEKERLDAARMQGGFGAPTLDGAAIADGDFGFGIQGDAERASAVPTKDFVINDDLIVDGSACIGFDCVNGESFGFDTLRFKENNLRIKFDDTSVAASFPRNDWQLTANDSANGGASKFSIDDISGGRTPFTVEANARSHSLYVDDGGRIGIRTSTPSVEVHVVDGDTPTLRLQQDGSSGFAPQTWDVAGNETNFFVRDVTNGSTLPLRIRPGASSSTIFIDSDSDVGIGTSSPAAKLDVKISANSQVQIGENLGTATGDDPQLRLINLGAAPANTWSFTVQDASFAIDDEDSVGVEFQLNDSGRVRFRAANVTTFDLATSGNLTITGTLTENSDINAKTDFSVVDPSDVLARLAAMPISTWAYRDAPGARHIGPMAQDFYNAFGLGGTATGLAPRNLASVALAAVQGLNRELEQKNAELGDLRAEQADLERKNAQLEERLAAIEALMATLAGASE